jgi:hypothetical protein
MQLLQPTRGTDPLSPAKVSAIHPTQAAVVVHVGRMGTSPLPGAGIHAPPRGMHIGLHAFE